MPTVTPIEGGLESPDGVRYEWSGFALDDALPEAGSFSEMSNYSVSVTAESENDVSFVTPGTPGRSQ